MAYTKQQLIDAYCRASNCQPADLAAQEVTVQNFLDRRRAEVQARLDRLPATAKAQMKNIALKQLAQEEAAQAILDNDGVDL